MRAEVTHRAKVSSDVQTTRDGIIFTGGTGLWDTCSGAAAPAFYRLEQNCISDRLAGLWISQLPFVGPSRKPALLSLRLVVSRLAAVSAKFAE